MSGHETAGDPRVLAGLQQAFNASDNPNVQDEIVAAWVRETGRDSTFHVLAAEIRAWTPQEAEPSLELGTEKTKAQQRYDEANELRYSNREVEMAAGAFDRAEEVAQDLDDWTHLIHMRLNTMSSRLAALEQHPEPTAPDGPVCACTTPKTEDYNGNKWCSRCQQFLPAPQTAPDLDPVRVEAAAKALRGAIGTPWGEIPAPSQAIYRHEAETVIRAYQNGGGA